MQKKLGLLQQTLFSPLTQNTIEKPSSKKQQTITLSELIKKSDGDLNRAARKAAALGSVKFLQGLLKMGVDFNKAHPKTQVVPAMLAAQYGNVEALTFLLEKCKVQLKGVTAEGDKDIFYYANLAKKNQDAIGKLLEKHGLHTKLYKNMDLNFL